MAQINSLNTSISDMCDEELTAHFIAIRARRRYIPPAKSKNTSATTARLKPTSKAGAPKEQDLFALIKGMTPTQKAALAAKLVGGSK